jgi:hypothetical protein
MAVGRQADDRAVAEHVALAVEEPQCVAEVEVARIVAVARRGVGVHAGIPFAALHQHRRVWDQRVAADIVEMEMRIGEEINASVRGRSLRADMTDLTLPRRRSSPFVRLPPSSGAQFLRFQDSVVIRLLFG